MSGHLDVKFCGLDVYLEDVVPRFLRNSETFVNDFVAGT